MKAAAIGYAAALLTIVVLDALWLGVLARDFYYARLGSLLLERPNWLPAAAFYLIHALGIVVFVLPAADAWPGAVLYGALFGICVYAAYDFTNLATVRGWPWAVSLADLAWGAAATAAAATASFFAVRAIAA